MQNPSINTYSRPDLDNILDFEERLLWSGQPTYGKRFFQAVGMERLFHFGFLFGVPIMWCTLPFINPDAHMGRSEAIWVYAISTIVFIGVSIHMAYRRQYVLSNLFYLVTDKRAIVCRRGANWRLKARLHVFSFQHTVGYPYPLLATHPVPSLQVGTLISEDILRPIAFWLSHPGQPPLRGRNYAPIVFEFVPNAEELREIIKAHTHEGNANIG